MEIASASWKNKEKQFTQKSHQIASLWGVSSVVRPGILDSALWTVKDGLFMCTCKNKHSEEDYEVEDKVVAALEKGIMAADANLDEVGKALDKQRIPKRMAAIDWGMKRHSDEFSWDKEGMRVRHISLDQVAECSNMDLNELSTIDTMSLKCPNKHRRLAYICRVLTKPKVEDGIVFHVEDPDGLSLPVIIKFPTSTPCYSLSIKTVLEELYPVGTILAIKELAVRYGKRGGYVICVDIPTDIVEIHPKDKLASPFTKIPPVVPAQDLEWESVKDLGNKALKNKNPIIAAKHYTSALADPEVKGSPSRQLLLYLNRAQALLDQKLFGAAYRDCLKAEKLVAEPRARASQSQRAKLYWRMANSAYGLRLWQSAEQLADKCSHYPESSYQLPELRRKLGRRRKEWEKGEYDWTSLFHEVHLSNATHLDVADYRGPIYCRMIPGRNTRSLVLSDAVKAGDLLLVSKAIITTHAADVGNAILPCVDNSNEDYIPPSTYTAINRAVHRYIDDPFMRQLFAGLDLGKNGVNVGTNPIPQWTCCDDNRLNELIKPVKSINLRMIRQAIVMNKISELSVPYKATDNPVKMDEIRQWPLMLFGTPTLLNHSCKPTTSLTYWGDVAVVRALYDLPKNCELTVERFDINATYAARLDISFSENIRCSCMLCKSDAKTEYDLRCRLVEEVYPKLLEDFTMDTSHPFDAKSERGFCRAKEWIRSWMQLERKVMSTYGDANKWLRTDLAPVRKGLARAWYLIDMKKGIETEMRLFEGFGCVWSSREQRLKHGRLLERICPTKDSLILFLLTPPAHYAKLQPLNRAYVSLWVRTALWAHQIIYGGNIELFKKRFAEKLPPDDVIDWEWKDEVKENGDGIGPLPRPNVALTGIRVNGKDHHVRKFFTNAV
ncbi:hypothetical protein LQV05_006361 [Cryptococcus neoformans]|nr:hypothetical protein J007_04709 [Cryptococcus neoformans var. grubii]OXC59705.1 hypothetical protein C358_04825 [Cryptococcus neoformans var. grubii MW-RSA852]UOH83628.1 hypothetical protein LQV05_006361 [Cryptococcus neoformans]